MAKAKDEGYEREVLNQADAVLMVSEDIKRSFINKSSGKDKSKFIVLPNGFDSDDFKQVTGEVSGEFVVTYVGTIADVYQPQVFFEAMKMLIEKNPNDKIRIRFVGSISPVISSVVERLGLKNHCEFISHVSHEVAINYMMLSTILLLVIPEVENNKGILTGKLFEYLNTRKPILGLGPEDGDAAVIINQCNAGKMFERTNLEEINSFLDNNLKLWKEGNLKSNVSTAVDDYSRRQQTKVLAGIINQKEVK